MLRGMVGTCHTTGYIVDRVEDWRHASFGTGPRLCFAPVPRQLYHLNRAGWPITMRRVLWPMQDGRVAALPLIVGK